MQMVPDLRVNVPPFLHSHIHPPNIKWVPDVIQGKVQRRKKLATLTHNALAHDGILLARFSLIQTIWDSAL